MTKNAAPCAWYFPNPARDKEKIQGHIIEQHSPALNTPYIATVPEPIIAITTETNPSNPKTQSVLDGLSLVTKNAAICIKTQRI